MFILIAKQQLTSNFRSAPHQNYAGVNWHLTTSKIYNMWNIDRVCLCVCCFLSKNSKVQKRGKINLIGRLQLTTERMREEENEGIVQLRILRTQV